MKAEYYILTGTVAPKHRRATKFGENSLKCRLNRADRRLLSIGKDKCTIRKYSEVLAESSASAAASASASDVLNEK